MKINYLKIDFKKLAQARSPKKIYFYSIIVGVVSGLSALGFSYLLSIAEDFTFIQLAGIDLGTAGGELNSHTSKTALVFKPVIFFLLPVVGALISGLLVQYFAPEASGAGTDAMIKNFHEKEGKVRGRTPIIKTLATISILAGGGSAGKEGPISQVGSAIGSLISQFLGLGPRARRTLFLAGMAGALGAIFRAPLGAALTSVEVLYKEDFESDSLIPCILSSITGYFIFTSFRGMDHIFHLPAYSFLNWYSLVFYGILGFCCMIFGAFFVKFYRFVNNVTSKINLPIFLKVTIGGVLVGCIGLVSSDSIGSGFGFLQKLMEGNNSLAAKSIIGNLFFTDGFENSFIFLVLFLLIVMLLKILATSFTIGTGGSGGVFGPSLVIGGTLGAIVGILGNHYFPNIVPSYVPFVIVGMGGFFAGVANAPIAAMIMVSELTGSYELLAPLAVVSIIAIIFSHKFNIYQGQKINKFESPAHHWDMTKDLLIHMNVKESFDKNRNLAIITEDTKVKNIFKIANKTHQTDFIVNDQNNKYKGIFSIRLLTSKQKQEFSKSNLFITDYMNTLVPPLKLNNNLSEALESLLEHDTDKVAVIDDKENMAGYLTFKDILRAYHKKVNKINV
ncbi:MAG: chloride channel protein [Spirochaetia bacterium]|nr:chloride channel protein [Spirochaetia bacterium]